MKSLIANRLKEWRKGHGLTQADFAAKIGMSLGVLKKYETGVNMPGGEALGTLAEAGVNINWLLTGKGEMNAEVAGSNQSVSRGEIDEGLLRQIIKELFEVIDEDGYEVSLDDLTKLIIELYFYFLNREIDTSTVKTFVRLVA